MKFTSSPSGQVIKSSKDYWYFLPNPLPPKLEINDMKFLNLLSTADRAVSQLAGVGYTIPNPSFLVIPYTRLEAVASSRIEGTQASLSELFYFEASSHERPPKEDLIEVKNYLDALFYGLERLQTLPMSLRLLREVHKRLMTGVRGGTPDKTPGEFRRSQNWIGSPGGTLNDARYVPPHHSKLIDILGDWEKFLHNPIDLPALIQCALMHYQFEAIHPFLDGNGRVGRLFISFFLIEKQVLPQPLLYLSKFFEQHRAEYYDRLLAVSEKGEWLDWIGFFLQAVIAQSNHAIKSAKRIIDTREIYRQKLQNNSKTRSYTALADFIFMTPYFNLNQAQNALNSSYNTAKKAVSILAELGLVEEVTGQARNRIYVARELLQLLEENEPIYKPNQ